MAQTTIPTVTGEQFAGRTARTVPHGWAGDDAAQAGLFGDVLRAIGQQLNFVLTGVQYAAAAQRLTSETFPELDLASTDFLGDQLPRPSGISDSAYAQLIISNLFQQADTRLALSNAIQLLTGATPRMMEPWNIFDTGVWDHGSYWDVDTPANPARYGDGSLGWQGFIETVPPSIPAIGANNPILAYDDGAFWDVPGYFFGTIQPVSIQTLYDLVNRLKVYGTTIWVKFLTTAPAGSSVSPNAPAGLSAVPTSSTTVVVRWATPTVGTPAFGYRVFSQAAGQTTVTLGPSTQTNSAVVSGLQPGTSYQFFVQASNLAGTSVLSLPATATTSLVPPGPATNLVATSIGPTSVVISFSPPVTGTGPFIYQALYRVTTPGNTNPFVTFGVADTSTFVVITGLQPNTTYDIEIRTSNQ